MDEDQKKCGGITLLGGIALAVSIACIAIGAYSIDFDQSQFKDHNIRSICRAEQRIPFYLLVAGTLNIIAMILRIIFQVRIDN